jgi:dynamin family protein
VLTCRKGDVAVSDSQTAAPGGVGTSGDDPAAVMQRARRALVWGGLTDVADRAWSQLTSPPPTPTLVVIGEVKRGKSSLVNALLAHPGVSPVDVEIATSAFLRFVPATDANVAGSTTLLFAGDRRQTIDYAGLADWVTTGGRHVTDPTVDELPIGAEVVVPNTFLPRLVIVDTPGVGGLNPNHLRLATTAAANATILLMTCDATAPITDPELSFLAGVSAEVDSVLIAVTKIDKNLRHWRSIVDENRRLLRQHAPRFADVPIVGISSLQAAAALKMEAGERRQAALRASGLAQLVQCLAEISSSSGRLQVANALRATRTGLQRVADQLAMQRSALTGTTTTTELNAEKERLKTLRQEWEGGWRDYLARDLNAVQRKTLGSLDHKIDELSANWRQRLEKTRLDVLRRSPQLFIADMTADLEAMVRELSDEYIEAVAKVVADLKLGGEVAIGGLSELGMRGAAAPKRGAGVFDPQLMYMGVVGTRFLGGGLIVALGIAGAAAFPLTLAIGGAWLGVNLGFRAMKAGRQNLLQWLGATMNAVSKDVSRDIQEKSDAIRPIIVNDYRQHLTDSMAQLQKVIAAAETAAKSSRAEQVDALKQLETRQKAVNQLIDAIETQLMKFAPAVVSAPS